MKTYMDGVNEVIEAINGFCDGFKARNAQKNDPAYKIAIASLESAQEFCGDVRMKLNIIDFADYVEDEERRKYEHLRENRS